MNKAERIKRARKMLQELGNESELPYGFHEFAQFCEEWLEKNLHHLSVKGLKKLMNAIESASLTGISRRNIKD